MPEPLLLSSREPHGDGDIVVLTFNDPGHLNAMTAAMGEALEAAVLPLRDDPRVRAVVLTGAGRAFSAGGDLEMLERNAARAAEDPSGAQPRIREEMRGFYQRFLAIRDLPCPTLAAVNGPAIGAGFCVALACDLRIVASDAKLSVNFTKLGLHPGMAATWTLPRIVGPAQAAELLYTSRMLRGEETLALGLANRVVERDEVLPTTLTLAQEIAACAPIPMQGIKRALARSAGATLSDQLDFEADEQAGTFGTEDGREGLRALREKRAPRFQGR